MNRIKFSIKFPGFTAADANRLATELKYVMEDAHQDVHVRQVREDEETMDFGGTLTIILGTAAVTAVAKGVQAWLEKNQSVEIEFCKDEKGERISAKGLRGKDAQVLADMILRFFKSN